MGFFDTYKEKGPTAPPSQQNQTHGVCEFCGWAGDDVLLGVCIDCEPEVEPCAT